MSKPTVVLSCDAGGIRSPIIAATVLKRLEENTGKLPRESFRIIAGTSGGSLVAAAVSYGFSSREIMRLVIKLGDSAFQRGFFHRVKTANGLLGSKYTKRGLMGVLTKTFGSLSVHELPVPVCIPITDLRNNLAVVIKSHDADDPHPGLIRLSDALYASSAAPTFFPPLYNRYVDGGLWGYSPTMSVYAEAKNMWPNCPVKILSIGSGKTETPARIPNRNPKALLSKIIEGAIGSQAGATSWMVDRIPDAELWRINPYVSSKMDDTRKETVKKLIRVSEEWFPTIDKFCETL